MYVWEIDFYRRPLQNEAGVPLWELVVCGVPGNLRYVAECPQSIANAAWLLRQLQQLLASGEPRPDRVHVFRPQTQALVEVACSELAIPVEATRRTPTLKQYLTALATHYPQRSQYTGQPYQPLKLGPPPPRPLSENLWGKQWRFASLAAGELKDAFEGRMIPLLDMPEALLPLKAGLATTTPIPGVVIEAGRLSMRLAYWIQETHPVALTYVPGSPDGLVLEAGLVDRWVVATFDDADVASAAQIYEQRKQASQGIHFLLVQPDDTGVTYSGFWLLKNE